MSDLNKWLNAVYDVLVDICGANESEREQFLLLQSDADYPREWRFQGHLGYGGKLWRDTFNRLYVNCYPEDETPKRKEVIESANEYLGALSLNSTQTL